MEFEHDQEKQHHRAVAGGLPLSFYIRSARLCLKKATLARLQPNSEGGGSNEELQHLRRFEALVACALPAHREYSERRGDKAVRELHVGLVEARRRIQEMLEAEEAISSPKKAGSPKKSSSPKKSGSPKRSSSPKKALAGSRPGSRPKTPAEKKTLRTAKSPRTPLLRSQTQPQKKIKTTAKRAESPPKKRTESPKIRKVESPRKNQRNGITSSESPKSKKCTGSESPKGKRQQKSSSDSPLKSPKSKRQQFKSPGVKDTWESKLHDVYTFDEKPSVYYLPRKFPTALQRNRKAAESSELRSMTPARCPVPSIRDSTRSLPTGRSDRIQRDQSQDRINMFKLRKSYDDLATRSDRHKLYEDSEDYCGRMEEYEPVLQRRQKSPVPKKGILEKLGGSKVEKVWDNLIYEKPRKAEGRLSPSFGLAAGPGPGPGRKFSDEKSYSCDGADPFDAAESRSAFYDSKTDDSKAESVKILGRDLRGSLDGFRLRLEEEGKRWMGRVNVLEKEIEFLRDETEGDLVIIRRSIQEEARQREICSDKLANSVEALEEAIAKEIKNLRGEVARKGDRQWMESVIKETVEKCLSHRSEKERPFKDELRLLRSEVEALSKGRVELENHVEQLSQIVENDKESMSSEQINIRTENGYIRKQLQNVKKDGLQARIEVDEFRKGCEADMEDLKRVLAKLKEDAVEMKIELQGFRALEDTLKSERGGLRRSAERNRDDTLNAQEKMVIMDRVENLSRLYLGGLDEVKMDILDIKLKCQDKVEELEDQLRDFKQRQESFPCSRASSRGPGYDELETRMSHLESKQELMHAAGLEEVRTAIFNLDNKCQDRAEEIEKQLKDLKRRPGESAALCRASSRDLLVDDLDLRLTELERKQESMQGSKYLLEDAVAVAEKERRLAASAASDAAAAASKAGDVLEEVLKALDPETRNKLKKAVKLHESLSLEKDAFSAAASDIRRTSTDVRRERDSALEAKRKAEELMEQLKDAVAEVDRQKDLAAQSAAKASSIAAETEDLLAEMAVMRRTFQLENGISDMDAGEQRARLPGTKKLIADLEKRVEALDNKSKNLHAKPSTKGKITSTRKKLQGEGDDTKLDTRLANLESHLEHVASATYTNLRILDTKVEHVSVGAQSALEGAQIAESKCGALGAELVKVFRVLASFKKENPEKLKESSRHKESISPGRRPHFACESCKKAASTILNGSLDLLPLEAKAKDVKKINVRLVSDKLTCEQEPQSPVAEREEKDSVIPERKLMTPRERIAKVEDSFQKYGPTRRSWGTGVTVVAEEDKLDTPEREKPSLEDINSWGIKSRGINVIQGSE